MQFNKDSKIDVERLKSQLLRRKITPQRFSLPMTHVQAADALTAAVMAEVERRHKHYRPSPEQSGYIDAAAEWLTDGGRFGLLLCGLPGNGKTTLMRAIASLIDWCNIKDDYGEAMSVNSYDARDVARINRESYDRFKQVANLPILALDDLGLEPTEVLDYGNVLSPVIDLLSVRYNKQLTTLVTTNLTGKDIRKKYGARIADRFNEMMQVIIFTNATYRGRENVK